MRSAHQASRQSCRVAAIALSVVVHGALSGLAQAQFLGTNFLTGNASGATANGVTSAAAGSFATASGLQSTVFGQNSVASGDGSTAVGFFTLATGTSSTTLGNAAQASAAGSTAVGSGATASGAASTAIGNQATASGGGSTVIGDEATASADFSTAVGFLSNAGFADSTAIGATVSTTRANQMALGRSTTTYTAAGITSAASTAAQSGPTQFVTTDAAGNLAAADFNALGVATTDQVERNTEGVSMAMALSGVPNILPEDTNYAVSTDIGIFDNETAVALGGAVRLDDNIFFNTGGAVSTSSGAGGGRAGVTVAW
jgi:hypothetical protein